MKYVCVLLALVGCAATATRDATVPGASPALARLERSPTVRGAPLPPRADAPRTVVVFFASW